jgi:hypothetical protein
MVNFDTLKQEYLSGMSLRELAIKYGKSTTTIRDWLKNGGFNGFRKNLTKEQRLRIKQRMSGKNNHRYKNAKLKGVCLHCGKYLEKPKCGRTEIKFCNNKCQLAYQGGAWNKGKHVGVGKDNPNWKGGTKNLQTRIRYSNKGREFIDKVFKRDDYTCQCCKVRGGKLHAHHIITFKDIFKAFQYLYYQLDVKKDSDELLNLSQTFNMFFNIDNGITLCETCHRKIHKQGDLKMKKIITNNCAAEGD